MKVLLVVPEAKFLVTHRLRFARAVRDQGHDVVLVAPDGDGRDAIVASQLRWIVWPVTRGGMNPLRELAAAYFLYRTYLAERPDLVHHVSLKAMAYGTPAARLARVPAVVNAVTGLGYLFTDGGVRAKLGVLFYRITLRHPNSSILVQNAEDERLLRNWFAGTTITRIAGSGIDLELFAPRSTGVNRDGPMAVVFVGRMLRHKGVAELIQAARLLHQRRDDIRVVLVGRADPDNRSAIDVEYLEAAVREGIVEWWGERSDIVAVLAQADVFCLPSYREGLSRSLLEAAACGLPIVTTDVAGCRDVVDNERDGLLVPPRDSEAVARAIARLAADPTLRRRLGTAARARAVACYSEPAIFAACLSAYDQLATGAKTCR